MGEPGSGPPSAPHQDREVVPPEQISASQVGTRGWVRQAVALSAHGVALTTPRAMLAGLCASALVPLALEEPGPAVASSRRPRHRCCRCRV